MFDNLKERETYWKNQFYGVKDYNIPKNHHALTNLVLTTSPNFDNLIYYMNNSPVQFTYHATAGYFMSVPAGEIIKLWDDLLPASRIVFYNCANTFSLTDEDALFLLNWVYQEDTHFLTGGISPDNMVTFTPHFHTFKNKDSSGYKKYISRMRKAASYNTVIQEILNIVDNDTAQKPLNLSERGGEYVISNIILPGLRYKQNPVLKKAFQHISANPNVIQKFKSHYHYSNLVKKLSISDLLDEHTRETYVKIFQRYYNDNKSNKNVAAMVTHALSFYQCSETELSRYLEIAEKTWGSYGSLDVVIKTMKETRFGGKFFPKYIVKKFGEDFTAENSDGILLPNNNFSETLNLYLKITSLSSFMIPHEREQLFNELDKFFIKQTGLSAPSSFNQAASILKTLLD